MDKLRVGVIGTGSVVREIYQYLYYHSAFSHQISIEAAANRSDPALNEFCDQYNIPRERRFNSYEEMIQRVPLDAVQVNTPDGAHEKPTVFALRAGLDVLVPKPTADTIVSAHQMIKAARDTGRMLVIDFHKRDDPRLKEAAARFAKGQYGTYQTSIWYMLDKLYIADPNHTPRFFASADYPEKNSPVSFLTVHMADALLRIIRLRPAQVRCTGWSQKLPSLKPIAVNGYDLCDTEITFDTGATAHIITGWHLPNTAHANTVQSARLICTDGMLDLNLDTPGYHELTAEGIFERNPLFRNFEPDGTVSGYGINHPGRLFQAILRNRQGTLTSEQRAHFNDPLELGFWTTVVLEAAEASLRQGQRNPEGITKGPEICVEDLLRSAIGPEAQAYLK